MCPDIQELAYLQIAMDHSKTSGLTQSLMIDFIPQSDNFIISLSAQSRLNATN